MDSFIIMIKYAVFQHDFDELLIKDELFQV